MHARVAFQQKGTKGSQDRTLILHCCGTVCRMAEIIYDVDEGVAVKGVRLVTLLVRQQQMPADKVCGGLPPSLGARPALLACAQLCDMIQPRKEANLHLRPLPRHASCFPSLQHATMRHGAPQAVRYGPAHAVAEQLQLCDCAIVLGVTAWLVCRLDRCARCTSCWWTGARPSGTLPRSSSRACWPSRGGVSSGRCLPRGPVLACS